MAAAVARIGELDRRECRAAVTGYFSAQRMVTEHLDLFKEILTGAHARKMSSRPVPRRRQLATPAGQLS
jgi:hypothetical protein